MNVLGPLHSKAELQIEKGSGAWSPARQPVLKKLKRSLGPQSVHRSIPSSATSQGLSTLDSTSSPDSISDSETEGSEYSSGSDEENEPEEPSPLPPTRPNDPIKAIEYDALRVVWAPRNKILSVAAIRTALGDFWAVLKGIRDNWKLENTELHQAKLKKNQPRIQQLTLSLTEHRRLLESCIRQALTHGHQDIVEKYVRFLPLSSPSQRFKHKFPFQVESGSTTLPQIASSYGKPLLHNLSSV